jgi:hypothetical protein
VFQLRSEDDSAVIAPAAWGVPPQPIACANITVELVGGGGGGGAPDARGAAGGPVASAG